MAENILVGIVMGSKSDLETVRPAVETLSQLGVGTEVRILSAHRTPNQLHQWASTAAERGMKVIIAAAGGAAALPGVVSSNTTLPVIGLPIQGRSMMGLDSLLSIVQMPGGIPVATVGVNNAKNAAVLAARIIAISDAQLRIRLEQFSLQQAENVIKDNELLNQI